ncbi:uncharacterized protein OCT59_023728 [Rhizophagus irregularis]|uniref:uncharacterized protein n=1 Tax=Rhizophagus irregularis TaxID=588596 RepID=UPI003323B10E|nr:hypothetical protein OCT59_023728 [Rhizophagus irregularis]
MAGVKLCELIKSMNVKGGGIVPFCKTRWTTAFQSISDIIRLKAVLEEVCTCLKYGVWQRIVIIAGKVAKNAGMDLECSRILCSQLLMYKNNETNLILMELMIQSNGGQGTKKESVKLSDSEINTIVNNSLAELEPEEEDDDEEIIKEIQVRRTTDRHPIPNNQVVVLIENTINVLHQNIIDGLDKDFLEDDDNLIEDNLNNDDNENNNCDNENDKEETGRGIINYNVEDLAKEFVDK